MRRAVVMTMVAGAVVVTAAAPAAAAAPVKQAGTSTHFYSEAGGCTSAGVCTEVLLDAMTGSGMGPGLVCLSVYTGTRTEDGGRAGGTAEYGCTQTDTAFSLTSELAATLRPTTVTLESTSCDGEEDKPECEVTGSRAVTVSATGSADGPVTTSRDRGRATTGGCRFSYSSTSTSAPLSGTLTVDRTTYDFTGQAGTTSYRFSSRKCPAP